MRLTQEVIAKVKKNKRCKKELFEVNTMFDTRTLDNWLSRNDIRLSMGFNLEIISKWLNIPIDQLTENPSNN